MEAGSLNFLVPITFFTGLMLLVAFVQYLSYRNRRETLRVIKFALQQGGTVDQQMIETIAIARPRRFADFRRGCVLLGLTISSVVFTFLIQNAEVGNVLRAACIFPGVLGLLYLLFHFLLPQGEAARQ